MTYTSPFFSNTTGYSGEVGLLDDLVREQIKLFGVDILYMPRKMLSLDKLLHESSKNAFEMAMPIPMYIKSFDGYDNGLEALTKFGVRSSDELTLQMSRSEFTTHYAPFLKSYYNSNAGRQETSELNRLEGETAARPKEGDLIYFPFDDGIFEIKYVQFDQPFFQLGKGYVFEIQCEKFEYSGDTFSTGYDSVDSMAVQPDYFRLEFNLEQGEGTFLQYEEVILYSMLDDDPVVDQEAFRLYKDPGFLNKVPSVKGKVMYWNLPDKTLTLSDLSDMDPTQEGEYPLEGAPEMGKDLDRNKFDNVMIVGQSSGSIWYSEKAHTEEKAFDDEIVIQQEFDKIKIVDIQDDNPFGFF